MITPSNQNQTPPPIRNSRFVLEPMSNPGSPGVIVESILKYPGRIIHELQNEWRTALAIWLLLLALFGMATYGVVVGSFSGGPQLWIAPAKLALGTLLSVLICLPSLYIFACLSGIDAHLRTVTGVLFAAVGLSALLLIGFAPVAWIFSQSTDSVAFMGALHLALWSIGICFGLHLINGMSYLFGHNARGHLKLWGLIFVIVCLQMTTTLRPIIAPGSSFFPKEKKFFLTNWFESMSGSPRQNPASTNR
jgi:hypothetical protein